MNLTIIQQKIFEIRGQKVILDRDLAALYGVETRTLNQAVRRNISIFPEDFMFNLTQAEVENLRSQIVISSFRHGGTRYKPMAFTEHGVTMLATVLKSPQARKMSVAIVRAFIALKRFVIENGDIIDQLKELKHRIEEHDIQLSQIYDTIENLLDSKSEEKKWEDRERIGFKK
jgi:phage regulator Rha-like protein